MMATDVNRGVIFDLDGVFVDTGWAHKQAWYDLAKKEGFGMSDEFFYSTFGMQNYQIIPMLLGREVGAEEVDRLANWKEQHYRDIVAEELTVANRAKELLEDLKGERFLLAIGSSAPRTNLDLILERLQVQTFFDGYVTKEDVSKGKPAPE